MTHTTEVVAYKKLSNGQFSYCIRCCANPSTDSWHTMDMAATDRAASLAAAHQRVANEHDAAIKAEAEALDQMGSTENHQI